MYRFMKDGLTGLWVRRVYEVFYRIGYYIRFHFDVYVAFIDIDDFKLFNTKYGHDGGDKVLKEIARLAKVRKLGCFACRYGGDEYCLMFFGYNEQKVVKICENLLQRIRSIKLQLTDVQTRKQTAVKVTATISIAEREQYARLLERVSKVDGKNRVITPAENRLREGDRS